MNPALDAGRRHRRGRAGKPKGRRLADSPGRAAGIGSSSSTGSSIGSKCSIAADRPEASLLPNPHGSEWSRESAVVVVEVIARLPVPEPRAAIPDYEDKRRSALDIPHPAPAAKPPESLKDGLCRRQHPLSSGQAGQRQALRDSCPFATSLLVARCLKTVVGRPTTELARELASPIFASWNQLVGWLRTLETLSRVA